MNRRYLQFITALLFSLGLFNFPAYSQAPSFCLNFDSLTAGTVYSPQNGWTKDALLFTQKEIQIRLRSFQVDNSLADIKGVKIVKQDDLAGKFPAAKGNVLLLENANLDFNFTSYGKRLDGICISFFSESGLKNFAINGMPLTVVKSLQDLNDKKPADNVQIKVYPDSLSQGKSGRICIEGNIQSLTIGGESLFIDEICIDLEDTVDEACNFKDFTVVPQPCTPNGIFFAGIKFTAVNPGKKGYNILVNGKSFGPFNYNAFPQIGPIPVTGAGKYEFVLVDVEDNSCKTSKGIVFNCGGTSICRLEGRLNAYISLCENLPKVKLERNNIEPADSLKDEQVEVFFKEKSLGVFPFSQLPATLMTDSLLTPSSVIIFKVCLKNQPDCCIEVVAKVRNCDDDDDSNCIRFNDLKEGKRYGKDNGHIAGDSIFVEDSVLVRIDSFLLDNGKKEFGYAEVKDSLFLDFFPQGKGNQLFISNVNLGFDFTKAKGKGKVQKVCFDFADGGGEENIRVNAGKTFVVKKLSELDKDTLAPGVIAYFVPGKDSTHENGTLCLVGQVDSLFIGGQEFGLDNVCFRRETEQECLVKDLKVSNLECAADGKSYHLTLGLTPPAGVDSLWLQTDESGYKLRFAVKDLPLRVRNIPIKADNKPQLAEVLKVCADLNDKDDDCCSKIEYQLPCKPVVCEIKDLQVSDIQCSADGNTYSLKLSLTAVNTPDSLILETDSGFRRKFAAKQLPLKLEGIPVGNNAGFGYLYVCAVKEDKTNTTVNLDCCNKIRYDLPCKPVACSIRDLKVTEVKCDSLGKSHSLKLSLIAENAGDSLIVVIGNIFKKVFPVKAFPVILENIPTGLAPTVNLIEVCAYKPVTTSARCCAQIRYETPCKPAVCSIRDLKVTDLKCDPNGRTFSLKLSLIAENAGDTLLVAISTGYNKKIAVKSFPVVLEGIPVGTSTKPAVIEVCAVKPVPSPLPVQCCARLEFELPCKPVICSIRDLKVSDIKCDSLGKTYSLKLSLIAENAGDSIIVALNNGFKKVFPTKAFPVVLEKLPLGNSKTVVVEVCAWKPVVSSTASCCARLEFTVPCITPPVCSISDLKVTDIKCSADGKTYSLLLNFNAQNTSDSLYLITESGFSKKIAAKNRPVRLEGIPVKGDDKLDVIKLCAITTSTTEDCCAKISYEVPCRPITTCSIRDLKVFDIKCDPSGKTYSLTLNLIAENAGDSLWVEFESGIKKRIAVKNLPVRIEGIPVVLGNSNGGLKVCGGKTNAEECCAKISFPLPCVPAPCALGEMKLEHSKCDEKGNFYLWINFEHKNTQDSFYLAINGKLDGKYAYKQLPLKLGPYQAPLKAPMILTAYDAGNRACNTTGILKPFDCQENCMLDQLIVFDIKCNNNGTYSMSLKLKANNTSGVLWGKTSMGHEFKFAVSDLPVRIDGIPVPADGYDVIKVCDRNRPDCCAELRYKIPCVQPEPCSLGTLTAQQVCMPSGLYYVKLNFEYKNTSKLFEVIVNGVNYGSYAYDKLPVQVGPFFRRDIKQLNIEVKDKSRSCSAKAILLVEPCASECNIRNLKTEVIGCEKGKFYAGLSFQPGDIDQTRNYVVFANGKMYGPYPYSQTSLKLGPFNANGVTQYNFLVVDLSNPTCYGFATIRPVKCSDDQSCSIKNLIVKPIECRPDGSQRLLVDFEYQADSSKFFTLSIDNAPAGNFKLEDLPVEIVLHKPANAASVEISACIRGAENCCTSAKVELLNCPQPCREPQIAIDRKDCDKNGLYEVVLKVKDGVDSLFRYAVLLNGKPLDTLSIKKLTISLDSLSGDSLKIYQVDVIDLNQPKCVKTFKLGPVKCIANEDEDKVWPGDANKDHIANYIDLLNVGVAFGQKGPGRGEKSGKAWVGVPAPKWPNVFSTGQNFKHADANGDGAVDEKDINVILENYGKVNGPVQPAEELEGTLLDPAIEIQLPNGGQLPTKGAFEIPIRLGAKLRPVKDIYALAFTVELDPKVFDLKNLEVVIPTSWMGQPDVNLAYISKIYPETGVVEIAISRTDQNEVSGFGTVAFLKGGIKDDIAGRQSTELQIRYGSTIDLQQEVVPIQGTQSEMQIALATGVNGNTKPSAEALRASLNIFPNPLTGDELTITNDFGLPIQEVQVLSLDGTAASPVYHETNRINLSQISSGLYIVRIKAGDYYFHEKLVKQQ